MTATYLQNRLPSAPLGGAISLHRLLPTSSLFSLPPRVFGCVAFVQDHFLSLYKLAPRALKGVFVGYSRTQKGYRVYFPDTCHYMTSTDVTDVSFSYVVKTQRRWSNKIYKTELTKTRYNNQVLGKYRVDPQRAGLTLIAKLTWSNLGLKGLLNKRK